VIIVSLYSQVLNAITERGTINRNGFNANIIPSSGSGAVLFARLVLIKCKFRVVGTRNSVPSVPRRTLPPANAYPLVTVPDVFLERDYNNCSLLYTGQNYMPLHLLRA